MLAAFLSQQPHTPASAAVCSGNSSQTLALIPIAYFGLVVSAVMAIALAANIVFLPALVLVVDRLFRRRRSIQLYGR